MSEIKKMYENAKVKPICDGLDYFTCTVKCNNGKYPEFTAEKQLELIKWLGKSRPIHITFLCDEWNIESMVRYGKRYNTFENALCGYTNAIWQYLTESEQEQIRSILK